MFNKLIFKLHNPSIESWDRYASLEEKLIVLCQTFGVRVCEHSNNEADFEKTDYVEFENAKNIINCIFQIELYLDSENLKFELVERSEIDAQLNEIGNLPLFKVNKLIDQLNKGL